MSTLDEIQVVVPEETKEKVKIKVGPETDSYNKVKLPETTDLRFHQYVEDLDNFKSGAPDGGRSIDFATRLRRGLMHNGSDNPDRGTVMVVFRGSANVDDFNTDRVFTFRNLPGPNPYIIPEIQPTLAKTNRYIRNKQFIIEQMNTYFNGQSVNGSNSYWDFYVTGHSLGGALSEVLSMDALVHGGYSFSAPVDNATTKHARSNNAPTFRSINKMDKVIGNTDTTTGGDAIYDNVIQGTVYNPNKDIKNQLLGHELEWFKNQETTTPFDVSPYNPGKLQKNFVQVGPIESINRTIDYVKPAAPAVTNMFTSGFNKLTSLLTGRRQPLLGRGKSRCWHGYKPTPGKKPYSKGSCTKKRKRGTGPPPSYPLSLSLAKDAYSEKFDTPQKHEIGRHEAILCPAPISCQEVKFYVCRWPRFNTDEERDDKIGDLVKMLTDTPMEYITPFDKPTNYMVQFKES